MFFALSSITAQEAEIGVVTFVKGEVSLIRDGKAAPLKVDEKISGTDTVEAAPGAKARIVFFSGDAKGMKVVAGGEKFEVARFLSQKPEERSLSSMAADILQAFGKKEEVRETVATTRDAKNGRQRLIVFPRGNLAGEIKEIIWRPFPKAKNYSLVIEYLGDTGKITKTINTAKTCLNKELPEFLPGVLYSLTISASDGKTEIAKDKETFSPPSPTDAGKIFSGTFSEIEKSVGDPEDPTTFLLIGNAFLTAGFFGEASKEFLRYSILSGKTGLATNGIRKALLKMKFLPSEADESIPGLIEDYGKMR